MASVPPKSLLTQAPPFALETCLEGAALLAVHQPGGETVVLETRAPGGRASRWLFSLHPACTRFGRTFARARRGASPPLFCQWLRTRLAGGRVISAARLHPQVFVLSVAAGKQPEGPSDYHLVLELNGRDSNLLLLDGQERLLIAMRHPGLPGRKLAPGAPYAPPGRLRRYPADPPLRERLPAPDEAAAREWAARWEAREEASGLEARRGPALKLVRRRIKALRRRGEKLAGEIQEKEAAEDWRRRGELLQIHRSAIQPGATSITVPDDFQPGRPAVEIPLDPALDAGENIARCFRTCRKLSAGLAHARRRLAETGEELRAWEAWGTGLEQATSLEETGSLAGSLPPWAGELRALLAPPSAAERRKPGQQDAPGIMRRISADGYTIWVGRSAGENEQVTFRLGRGRDWWFHAQGIPGSHVLVRNPGDGALPPRTLNEAAWLAAYYSQGRERGKIDVDYTQRKHVRKVKGGARGTVTISQNRTVVVDARDEALRAVLERVGDGQGGG